MCACAELISDCVWFVLVSPIIIVIVFLVVPFDVKTVDTVV